MAIACRSSRCPRARHARRPRVWLIAWAMVAGGMVCGPRAAHAARVTLSGPEACVEASAIEEQASDLIGRPLATVTGVDFAIELGRLPAGKWRLRLDTMERDRPATEADAAAGRGAGGAGARRSRTLKAATCGELADAAAVAIAMSVRALSEPPAPAQPPPAAPSPAAPASSPAPEVSAPPAPIAFAAFAAVVGDAGGLPGPTAGGAIGAWLRLRRLEVGLSGVMLAPRTQRVQADEGGSVGLTFGAVEACAPVPRPALTLLGCAAYELGRLSAEGVGISHPRLGSALWQAGRVEAGLRVPLGARAAFDVRAGAALPLARPQFVIEGTVPVYRPAAVTARVQIGLELEL